MKFGGHFSSVHCREAVLYSECSLSEVSQRYVCFVYFLQRIIERGLIFNDTYSPYGNSSNWLGLHKAGDDFAGYVSVSWCCCEDPSFVSKILNSVSSCCSFPSSAHCCSLCGSLLDATLYVWSILWTVASSLSVHASPTSPECLHSIFKKKNSVCVNWKFMACFSVHFQCKFRKSTNHKFPKK